MATRGRKPKLTDETMAWIAAAVRRGLSLTKAARLLLLAPRTVWNWMTIGRNKKRGRYAELVRAVKKARAEFVADQLDTVVRAAKPTRQVIKKKICHKDGSETTVEIERVVSDWRAAWRLLEVKAPEEFGRHRLELKKLKKEMADLELRFRALLEGKYPELVALLERRAGGGRVRSPSGRFARKPTA